MTTKPVDMEKNSARARLLAAAETLFYEEGIHTVGIDRVIERAGVAKASLYNVFGSKDELIRAYLMARHDARKTRIEQSLERHDSAREKILAIFEDMRENASKTGYRGCAFVRASAENREEPGVRSVCKLTREWMHGLFVDLARQAGATDPARLGRQLVLLYEGAAVSGQMDADAGGAKAAGEAAATLLSASGNTTTA